MKSYNEEFELVLDEMTNEFSTNNFISKLKLIGVPIKVIENQYHVQFLNSNCERITKRIYRKKMDIGLKINQKSVLNFLQKTGYKQSFDSKKLLGELHKEYLSFCKENNTMPLFIQEFHNQLNNIGYKSKRLSNGINLFVSKNLIVQKELNNDDEIKNAIELLKSLGYKILKATTEYQEI
jgi:hypothetical protein